MRAPHQSVSSPGACLPVTKVRGVTRAGSRGFLHSRCGEAPHPHVDTAPHPPVSRFFGAPALIDVPKKPLGRLAIEPSKN